MVIIRVILIMDFDAEGILLFIHAARTSRPQLFNRPQ